MQVDEGAETVDHLAVPVGPAELTAGDELDARVEHPQRPRPAGRLGDVLLGGEGADLPGPVDLVPESPPADPEGRFVPVASAPVCPPSRPSELQYSSQASASSRVPVPMFRQM